MENGVKGERYEMRCDSIVTKTSFSDDDVEPESVSIEGREGATFLKVEVDDLTYIDVLSVWSSESLRAIRMKL